MRYEPEHPFKVYLRPEHFSGSLSSRLNLDIADQVIAIAGKRSDGRWEYDIEYPQFVGEPSRAFIGFSDPKQAMLFKLAYDAA
jgi:hypothetical protein